MFFYNSPIGPLGIEMLGSKVIRIARIRSENGVFPTTDPASADSACIIKWLDDYFNGKKPSHNHLPILLNGTPFQNYIWHTLQTIPYGQSLTYGQIAKLAASHFGKEKMSAQAIGQAVSKNPLLIVVPCHRVIGANKKITGFSAGIDVKQWLLDYEGIQYI